jgi:hypothetical protein
MQHGQPAHECKGHGGLRRHKDQNLIPAKTSDDSMQCAVLSSGSGGDLIQYVNGIQARQFQYVDQPTIQPARRE